MMCIEFFEEMLSLVFNLTQESISDRMWQTLPLLFDLFNKDNTDYFTGKTSFLVVPFCLYVAR